MKAFLVNHSDSNASGRSKLRNLGTLRRALGLSVVLLSSLMLADARAAEAEATAAPAAMAIESKAGTLAEAIRQEKVFAEPIEYVGVTVPPEAESQALYDALVEMRQFPDPKVLEKYIAAHQNSVWVPSVRTLLGQWYAGQGRMSAALEHWSAAWPALKSGTGEREKRTGDYLLAHWTRLLTGLGQVERLEQVLEECTGRTLDHPDHGKALGRAAAALERSKRLPWESFRCGTVAMAATVKALNLGQPVRCDAFQAHSPPEGFSLRDLEQIAQRYQWPLVAVERTQGVELLVPSVVHWRQGHYGAIVARRGFTYLVQDPVLGGERWLHMSVINEEASGRFMAPESSLTENWRRLDSEEAGKVRGRGDFAGYIDDTCDHGCPKPTSCCNGMPTWWITEPYINQWLMDRPLAYQASHGQPVTFELTFKEREARDYPVVNRYTTDLRRPNWNHSLLTYVKFWDPYAYDESRMVGTGANGPVFATLTANVILLTGSTICGAQQLGVSTIGGYGIIRTGANYYILLDPAPYNCSDQSTYWAQQITDVTVGFPRPAYSNYVAEVNLAAGGMIRFNSTNASGWHDSRSKTEIHLIAVGSVLNATNGFQLWFPDGSMDLYALVARATNTLLPEIAFAYVTASVDAAGRTSRYVYETNTTANGPLPRVKYFVDSDGRTNTVTYHASYPNLVTQVQDPYGRTTSLGYSSSGVLTNIVDALGITNSFTYVQVGEDAHPAVGQLRTPYGITSFVFTEDTSHQYGYDQGNFGGHDRVNRSVTITNPDGGNELYCFRHDTPETAEAGFRIPAAIPEEDVPQGVPWDTFDTGTPTTGTCDRYWSNVRNSFHWSSRQYARLTTSVLEQFTPADFLRARMRHWLVDTNECGSKLYTVDTLSWEREASADGLTSGGYTLYDYPGKPNGLNFVMGTDPYPSTVARRLANGDTEYTQYVRNDLGHPTSITTTYAQTNGARGTRQWSMVYNSTNYIDLIRVLGPDGKTNAQFAYDHHQVTLFTNADWAVTTLQYNSTSRNVTNIILPTQAVIQREYYPLTPVTDANAGFLKEERWVGLRTNSFGYQGSLVRTHTNELRLITTLTWDNLLRLRRVDYPDGTFTTNDYTWLDLTMSKDRLGYTNRAGFDSRRRKLWEVDAASRTNLWSYCSCGDQPESFTNALGQVTTWMYDDNGRRVTLSAPDRALVNYQYDRWNRLTNVSEGVLNYALSYNHQGLLTNVASALGGIQRAVYDIYDRPVSVTDRNGVSVTRSYDPLHRLLTQTWPDTGIERWQYRAGYSGPVAYTNQLGNRTLFEYDGFNQQITVTNANNEVVRYTYQPDGQLRTLQDGKVQTTTWTFDAYGRTTKKGLATGATVWTNGFNANGWLTARWTAFKGLTQYGYDTVGNVTSVNYPVSPDLTLQYDALNRLTNLVDAVGTSRFTYNAQGALLAEDGPWANDTVSRAYTPNGQRSVLSVEQPSGSWAQGYAFDAAGRLTNIVAASGVFGYRYAPGQDEAALGALVGRLDLPNGGFVTNWFDSVGRLLGTSLRSGAGSGLDTFEYAYDLGGFRSSGTYNAANYWTWLYDKAGQLTNAVGREAGGTTLRLNEQFRYRYDAAGNLAVRTNNALVQTFTVNSLNQYTAVSRSGTLTVAGSTTTSAPGGVGVNGVSAARYADNTFAAAGLGLTNGPNVFTASATNSGGTKATDTAQLNLADGAVFQYDGNGNLIWDGSRKLEYDDADQLIRVTTSTGKSQFAYDGLGRRRVRQEYGWSPSGGATPLVTSVTAGGTLRTNFTGWVGFKFTVGAAPIAVAEVGRWVVAGNTGSHAVKLVRADTLLDVPGAMATVTTAGATAGQFAYATLPAAAVLEANTAYYVVSHEVAGTDQWYDWPGTALTLSAAGTLYGPAWSYDSPTAYYTASAQQSYVPVSLKYTAGSWGLLAETRYVYDGLLPVQERDGSNNPTVAHTRGPDLSGSLAGAGGIGGLLARSTVNVWPAVHYYYHADGNGNVTALVAQNHTLAARYSYDAFGNLLTKAGPLAEENLYRFSSKEYHAASGLVYYGYRFYDPNLQRWLNRDPLGEDGGINLYGFVRNNPLGWVDSWGWQGVRRPPAEIEPRNPIEEEILRNYERGGDVSKLSRGTRELLRDRVLEQGLGRKSQQDVTISAAKPPPVLSSQAQCAPSPGNRRPGTRGHPDHQADVEGPGRKQAEDQALPGETVLTEEWIRGYPGVRRRADNQVVGVNGRTRLTVESERRPNGSYHQRRVESLEDLDIMVQTRVLPPRPK